MNGKNLKLLAALMMVPLIGFSQVKKYGQQQFRKTIPAGNYSGIAPLGGERYAVVSDKSKEDGFFVFRLQIDTVKGKITAAQNEGFYSAELQNRDMEGIAFRPTTHTLFISGETDNDVYEYTLDGKRTGRKLAMPECYHRSKGNFGLESLTYDAYSRRFYTTSERTLPGDSLLRIQSFGDDLKPLRQYLYRPDEPISRKYYYGVSALCALNDGCLLVMERQIRIPRLKIGAKTNVRLYKVHPAEKVFLEKQLILEFTTRNHRFANYEGMCMPFPGWLLLIADSQDQQAGVLRDWMRLVRIQ